MRRRISRMSSFVAPAIADLSIADGFCRCDHFANAGQCEFFEIGGIRQGHILAADAHDRRVEIIEGLLHDASHDLGPGAGLRPALLDSDAPPVFLTEAMTAPLSIGRSVRRSIT